MSARTKLSPLLFGLAIVLIMSAVGLVGYLAFVTLRPAYRWETTIQATRVEYSSIANHVEESVGNLNGLLFRCAIRHEKQDRDSFESESQKFRDWLTEQRSRSNLYKVLYDEPVSYTSHVRKLWDDLDLWFDQYRVAARVVLDADQVQPSDLTSSLSRFESANEKSRRLLALAADARAHAEAAEMFAWGSKLWFMRFQRLVLVSLMVGAAGWVAVAGYRRMLGQLRRKHIEGNAIIQRQKKFADLGELAASVAHEIRNPLTAINARLYTLQKSLSKGTAEHTDAMVIRGEIDRLDRIVKDFLKLAGPAEPQFVTMTAEPLLKEVTRLLAPQLQKQSIELTFDSAVATPFRADPDLLKQVLINLIQNAAESINEKGEITLRARRGTFPIQNSSGKPVIIEVEDDGPGIPPEVQERLFEPFFSTKPDGTGLGLPISARIIARHRGALNFETKAHRGTTFRIVLPALDDAR